MAKSESGYRVWAGGSSGVEYQTLREAESVARAKSQEFAPEVVLVTKTDNTTMVSFVSGGLKIQRWAEGRKLSKAEYEVEDIKLRIRTAHKMAAESPSWDALVVIQHEIQELYGNLYAKVALARVPTYPTSKKRAIRKA